MICNLRGQESWARYFWLSDWGGGIFRFFFLQKHYTTTTTHQYYPPSQPLLHFSQTYLPTNLIELISGRPLIYILQSLSPWDTIKSILLWINLLNWSLGYCIIGRQKSLLTLAYITLGYGSRTLTRTDSDLDLFSRSFRLLRALTRTQLYRKVLPRGGGVLTVCLDSALLTLMGYVWIVHGRQACGACS